MSNRPLPNPKNRSAAKHNMAVSSKRMRLASRLVKRADGDPSQQPGPYFPTEDWYEPSDDQVKGYKIIVQNPGKDYRHVVTPQQIRQRLALLPPEMIKPLDVIQLSRMTRKKESFPCYGMQWGSALYLYPIENSLQEHFARPPRPSERIEARMYGGRWINDGPDLWRLLWNEQAIQNYYLNNILIHELGHLLDSRNTSYSDRERFAEWFAIEHGYKPSRRADLARKATKKMVRRRHHS